MSVDLRGQLFEYVNALGELVNLQKYKVVSTLVGLGLKSVEKYRCKLKVNSTVFINKAISANGKKNTK